MLDRRSLPGGITALVSKRLEALGFLVAFTERGGGRSAAPYRSLNLGSKTKDDPARVLANRRLVCAAFDISNFAVAEQVHGARLAPVGPKRAGAGFERPAEAIAGVDALATASRGVALGVLTADCVPLALVDPERGRVAVVHAGWRGIASGIVAIAASGFEDPGRVHAVIGPAVGPDHYEVGEDVALAVSGASKEGAVTARAAGRLCLDLPSTVVRILKELGVGRVERDPSCTACERGRFFSHRRDGETGRQALIAVQR